MTEKPLVVVGTITIDRIHTQEKDIELVGGSPWFASQLALNLEQELSLITNVGFNFDLSVLRQDLRQNSDIRIKNSETTLLEIFPEKPGVPAVVKSFTGDIEPQHLPSRSVVVISTLFQEVTTNVLSSLKQAQNTILLDIQGFTRPEFANNINLSDSIKRQPENLELLCAWADVLKISENELESLFPDLTIEQKLEKLHQLGLKSAIVTLGSKGAILSQAGEAMQHFQVEKVEGANIIGAGDKFLILVGSYLSKNYNLAEAITLAQAEITKLLQEAL